ncbi:hypothetical protein [Herbaspirillum frisingense]|nr:hypothetical protein [Herbaspirillum frisingense]UIN20208.1 hypothetical protein LAZ82_17195 [Herbaspirillum frisingense]
MIEHATGSAPIDVIDDAAKGGKSRRAKVDYCTERSDDGKAEDGDGKSED